MKLCFPAQLSFAAVGLGALILASALPAAAADTQPVGIHNRSIGYVTSSLHWAMYQTADGKAECPDGFTDYGPRERFKAVFPNGGTVADTQLKTESEIWFPQDHADNSPFRIAKGNVGVGLNLDGKVGPNDFTSPTGEKGIDNQLSRALGCSLFFRGPDGTYYIFGNKFVQQSNFDRTMIEITNVDSLLNAPDVDVTIYRGLDRLMTDATGDTATPGGSQRVDARFGKKYITHMKGKIVDGVLTTEPADANWPWMSFFGVPDGHRFLGMRFRLNVTPTEATGLAGAYVNVDEWYTHLLGQSTHHLSYGQLYGPALYTAMKHLADGYPDKNGVNTAISSALDLKMTQVFIIHPDQATAATDEKPATTIERARR